jgi:4-amino-4-deoxy-L-arabinose transferase-like glycosyltransferase
MRRFWLWLLSITVVAGGLRFAVLDAVHPVHLTGDEAYYVQTAFNLKKGFGYGLGEDSRAAWPPGHSYLLSHFVVPKQLLPRGDFEAGVRGLQTVEVALGTLLVLLTGLLGAALFDRRVGLAAAGVAAVYPTFIAFSHSLWSDNLFTVLLLAALVVLVHAERRGRLALAVLAGLLFGGAGLTREVAVPIAIACALWLGARHKSVVLPAALLVAAAAVVLPWTWRNFQLFERFVPVSTVGWMGVREGNTLAADDWTRADAAELVAFRERYHAVPGELERADVARREALALIAAEQPTWIFKKLVRNTAMLFAPDSFLFKRFSRASYGQVPLGRVRAALVVTTLLYVLVVVGAVLGIAGSGDGGRRGLALLIVGVVVLLHVLAQATTRYRLPLMPLALVFACRAALEGRALGARLSRGARFAALALLVYFLAWCVPYFADDAVALWMRGTYVEPLRP